MNNDTHISFFRGETEDGYRFVISVEGGGVPGDLGVGSGLVESPDGLIKIRGLTAQQAVAFKNELALSPASKVFRLYRMLMS